MHERHRFLTSGSILGLVLLGMVHVCAAGGAPPQRHQPPHNFPKHMQPHVLTPEKLRHEEPLVSPQKHTLHKPQPEELVVLPECKAQLDGLCNSACERGGECSARLVAVQARGAVGDAGWMCSPAANLNLACTCPTFNADASQVLFDCHNSNQ
eukprot:m.321197 g.321197  ORF g.321197 m.321197 type:complete len:153 (+) comp15996_c1_seq3:2413-2871(+)